jgi:hypothetical protein
MYLGICWPLELPSGAALSTIKQLSLSNSSHRGNYRGGYLPPPEQMRRRSSSSPKVASSALCKGRLFASKLLISSTCREIVLEFE